MNETNALEICWGATAMLGFVSFGVVSRIFDNPGCQKAKETWVNVLLSLFRFSAGVIFLLLAAANVMITYRVVRGGIADAPPIIWEPLPAALYLAALCIAVVIASIYVLAMAIAIGCAVQGMWWALCDLADAGTPPAPPTE